MNLNSTICTITWFVALTLQQMLRGHPYPPPPKKKYMYIENILKLLNLEQKSYILKLIFSKQIKLVTVCTADVKVPCTSC